MRLLARGALLGLAFGLAVAVVDLALGGIGTIQRRFGAGPYASFRVAGLEIALAALLGVVVSPLLRLRVWRIGGSSFLAAGLLIAWLALGWWVQFEAPIGTQLLLAPPLGAAVLLPAGWLLGRWRTWIPWTVGAVLLLAAAVVPTG